MTAAQDTARALYGYLAVFLDHPEIGPLISQAAAEGWDQARLQGALSQTNWWKNTQESARLWEALRLTDYKTAEARWVAKMTDIRTQANRLGIYIGNERLALMGDYALRFGWTDQQVTEAIVAEMWFDPHARPGDQMGGEMGRTIQQVRAMAEDYFVPLSYGDAFHWARNIVMGNGSIEGVEATFINQARGRFPHLNSIIEAGTTPAQFFASYRNLIAEELEIEPTSVNFMSDKRWLPVISHNDGGTIRPMTLSETSQYVRRSPEWWKNTRNSDKAVADTTETILRTLGEVAT